MCIEIVEKNNEDIITNNGSQHIIAHAELSKSGKENQVGHKKETGPGYHVCKYRYECFVVSQSVVEVV
jgi:hypothetical protein